MKIIPAIDLLDGKAVRLRQGRREDATIYADRPWELVDRMIEAGAERIHIVDLDGAFAGERRHQSTFARIADAASGRAELQVGGGLRSLADVEAVFAAGARYAVLGTVAVTMPDQTGAICRAHPGRIIIAVDARDGRVAIAGWAETSDIDAVALGRTASAGGAAALLYTDISRDGVGTGPNVEATATLARAVTAPVIASGGIASLADLRALTSAQIPFAIVGRALYEQSFTLEEAIRQGEVSGC